MSDDGCPKCGRNFCICKNCYYCEKELPEKNILTDESELPPEQRRYGWHSNICYDCFERRKAAGLTPY
jgi:hypothetical protein